MWKIVKCDVRRLLKNPLYYIGFLLIVANVWMCCKGYLDVHYFEKNYKPVELSTEERVELDVNKGYIPPLNESERVEIGLNEFKEMMINDNVMSANEVDTIINEILSQNFTVEEALNYLNKDKNIHISSDIFSIEKCLKAASADELNNYIKEKLSQNTYTTYFARKFADYFGIHLIILISIVLIFLTMYDYSKNTYELLHTKVLSPPKYIMAKVSSGVLSIMVFVIIIAFVFDGIATWYGIKQGFSVNVLDMWKYIILCTVPSVIFSVCFNIFITSLFKKPIISIPLMMLLLLYANQGLFVSGEYSYQHRLFQVTSRFPGLFFETSTDNVLLANQSLLIILSVIMIALSCKIWERRRML